MTKNTKHYPDTAGSPELPKLEEGVLKFWKEDGTFRKSLENRAKNKEWIFYDGPPFANGLPHYGHLLTSVVKDIFARYHTMKGEKVERRFGWDCHGLPAEMEAEKELSVSGRAAIEKFGIDNFNNHCRTSVMKYTDIWENYVERAARWVDFKNDYKTMDKDYMESVLWAFKQLYDKGLVYESHRVMPYSWAAQTPLSNFETKMDDAYREVTDKAITVAFKLKEVPVFVLDQFPQVEKCSLLAWTTTPWTLPSNLSLAVGKNINYQIELSSKDSKECRIQIGPNDNSYGFGNGQVTLYDGTKGSDLIGLEYEPLFPYFKDTSNAFKILDGSDFIEEGEGTGVVHLAPGFGEDDQRVCEAAGIELVCPVDEAGRFTDEIFDIPSSPHAVSSETTTPPQGGSVFSLKGQHVFDTNVPIIKRLKEEGKHIKTEQYKHSYPHCWRTDTPLIYKAVPSWYVEVTKFKDRMVELNQEINWIPEHIRDGQFGKWLENARDWSISRNRYWGTPIPVWRTESGKIKVFGSIKELEEFFEIKVEDLHRPFIDSLTKEVDGETYTRVTDVFDCWFESGSMPFAQVHYPFENKDWFEKHFPADFIVEYIGQTRGWFYTLVVLATALFDKIPFKNCICHGILLAEDGKKLSKKLRNYPDPNDMFNVYGADAMRWRMIKEPVMHGGNLLISKDGNDIRDVVRLSIKPIWNAYHFFCLYANTDGVNARLAIDSDNLMDRYILSKLKHAVEEIDKALTNFVTPEACKAVENFFEVLNNWYIRRNRDRFWRKMQSGDDDKYSAYNTLYTCLSKICRAAAPLLPLVTEEIYRGLTNEESVHLADFPDVKKIADEAHLVQDMDRIRDACNVTLAIRNTENMRIRQPLAKLTFYYENYVSVMDYATLIADEVNVKEVVFSDKLEEVAEHKLTINFSVAGKRLGAKMKEVAGAAKQGKWKIISSSSLPESQRDSRAIQKEKIDSPRTSAGNSGNDRIEIAGEILQEGEYQLLLEPKTPKGAQALSTQDALVVLDLEITPQLAAEGLARDLVRMIQEARKEADLNITDRINLVLEATENVRKAAEANKDYITEQTLAKTLDFDKASTKKHISEQKIGGEKVIIGFEVAA